MTQNNQSVNIAQQHVTQRENASQAKICIPEIASKRNIFKPIVQANDLKIEAPTRTWA